MQKEELVPVLQDILLGGTGVIDWLALTLTRFRNVLMIISLSETSANELIWFFAFLMNNYHYWERLEKEGLSYQPLP